MNSVTMRNSAYFHTWEQVDIEVFSAENVHSIPRKRVARGREHVRDFDVWKAWECRPRIWDPSVAGFFVLLILRYAIIICMRALDS